MDQTPVDPKQQYAPPQTPGQPGSAPQQQYAPPQGQPYVPPQAHTSPQEQPFVPPQPYVAPQEHLYSAPQSQPYVVPQQQYAAMQPAPFYPPYQFNQPQVVPISKSFPAVSYKKKLRKTANLVASSLILFYIIYIAVAIVAFIVGMAFDKTLIESFAAVDPLLGSSESIGASTTDTTLAPATSEPVQLPILGIISIVSIIFGALAFFVLRGRRLVTTDIFQKDKRMKVKDLLILVSLVLGIQGALSLGQILMGAVLSSTGVEPVESMDTFAQMMNLPGILYIVLLGPIVEEIMFRGAIMRALQPYGQNFAIVLSSVLFGLYHLFLIQSIFAFFIGIIFAYTAMRYSLKWAVLLHIINNGLVVVLTFFGVSEILQVAAMLLFLALGIIAVYPAVSKIKKQLHAGKPTPVEIVSETTNGEWSAIAAAVKPKPYLYGFFAPVMIVGVCTALIVMFAITMIM